MPYNYSGKKGDKAPREEAVIEIQTVGVKFKPNTTKTKYIKFVTTEQVEKLIKNPETGAEENRKVYKAITLFGSELDEYFDFLTEAPEIVRQIDDATEKGTKTVKVRATYYIGKSGDERVSFVDLKNWEIVG